MAPPMRVFIKETWQSTGAIHQFLRRGSEVTLQVKATVFKARCV